MVPSILSSCEQVDRTPEQRVRDNCEKQCHQQCLARIEPAEDSELVDGVKNKGNDENFAHRSPTGKQYLAPLRRVGHQSKRFPPCASVPFSVPNGEEGRHEWLKDEPKMQRSVESAQEILKGTCQIPHPPPQSVRDS